MIDVLAVDDSEQFLAAVSTWIGTQPRLRLAATARGGREALRAVEASAPDLVLVDAFMPGLDGFATTRRIKSRPHAPLVVIVSVHEGSAVEQEAWAAGADGFVSKAELHQRLPDLIEALVSGRPPQRRPEDRARARRDARGTPPNPESPVERSASDADAPSSAWRAVWARLRKLSSIDRRPAMVSAGSD